MGRRPVLLLSLAGSTVAYACFGIATLWHSLAGMFLADWGRHRRGNDPDGPGVIADITPLDKRTRAWP